MVEMTKAETEIPDQVRVLMRDEEIENMENLEGWAVGVVSHVEVDEVQTVTELIEDAWIELCNGEGRSGSFGGVKAHTVDDEGNYREVYAYGSREAFHENTEEGWYVKRWIEPEDPGVGREAP